jgi:hypothetical protein
MILRSPSARFSLTSTAFSLNLAEAFVIFSSAVAFKSIHFSVAVTFTLGLLDASLPVLELRLNMLVLEVEALGLEPRLPFDL